MHTLFNNVDCVTSFPTYDRPTDCFSVRAGRYVNQAGRKGVRAGCKTVMAGHRALRHMPSWNHGSVYPIALCLCPLSSVYRGVTWPYTMQP